MDAAFEDQGQRSNAPGDGNFGTANVIFERALTVRDLSLRQELLWTLGSHVLEAGGEAHHLSTGLRFQVTGDRNTDATNGSSQRGGAGLPDLLDSTGNSTRGGAWLQDTWRAGARASVEAGLRLDYAGFTGETLISPRASGTFSLSPSTRVKAAVGQYTQSPGYEKLAQSDYVLDFTNDAVRGLRSERATQASAGLERDLGRGVSLRAEGLLQALQRRADRPARAGIRAARARGALRLPGVAGVEHPDRPDHHHRAHQRRARQCVWRRPVRVAHGAAARRAAQRMGELHVGHRQSRRLRPPLSLRVPTGVTRSAWSRPTG